MHRAASHRQYAAWSLRTDSAKAGLEPMTLVAGVSASIHEAKITGNASGPFRLNKNACARGGSRNHAATISAPFVTSAVGISHGGRTTLRYSLPTARRSPGTASISTSSPSRHGDTQLRDLSRRSNRREKGLSSETEDWHTCSAERGPCLSRCRPSKVSTTTCRAKIYDRSHEPEINRAGTWTFDQLCAPMDLRARTGGEAPASWRLKTWI